jgi:hypothetical protein
LDFKPGDSSLHSKSYSWGESLEPSPELIEQNKKRKIKHHHDVAHYRLNHNGEDPPKNTFCLPLEDLGEENEVVNEHIYRITQ